MAEAMGNFLRSVESGEQRTHMPMIDARRGAGRPIMRCAFPSAVEAAGAEPHLGSVDLALVDVR